MTGFVYFIRCGDFVKIGYSATPKQRIVTFRTSTPYDVGMLGYYPGTKAHERALHLFFAHVRRRREWFEATQEILAIAQKGLPELGHIQTTTKPLPLQDAIKKVGSANELARLVGVTPQAISQWRRVPIERAADVAKATGIPRETLRPDIWGGAAA